MMNVGVKSIPGTVYGVLRKIRNSEAVRSALVLPVVPLNLRNQHRNGDYFAFDIAGKMGLGAMFTHVVKLLKYADDHNRIPVVRFTNPLYSTARGEDWFNVVLTSNHSWVPGSNKNQELRALRVINQKSYLGFQVAKSMSIVEANELFFRHCRISQKITDICDKAMETYGLSSFDMSIHYRGTDKNLEAHPVSFETVAASVRAVANMNSHLKTVFLATDVREFEYFIKEAFPEFRFFTYNLGSSDEGGVPCHFSSLPGETKAVEALVNILLLGRSVVCIRTTSYLSAWSKIFNPALKTFTLNRPHANAWAFPEAQICDQEARGAQVTLSNIALSASR
jgi:hypothetical protein